MFHFTISRQGNTFFIYLYFRENAREIFLKSEDGKETQIRLNMENMPWCQRFQELFYLKFVNTHVVISAISRSEGTNYSFEERVLVFLCYIFIVMVFNAIFYMQEQHFVTHYYQIIFEK